MNTFKQKEIFFSVKLYFLSFFVNIEIIVYGIWVTFIINSFDCQLSSLSINWNSILDN